MRFLLSELDTRWDGGLPGSVRKRTNRERNVSETVHSFASYSLSKAASFSASRDNLSTLVLAQWADAAKPRKFRALEKFFVKRTFFAGLVAAVTASRFGPLFEVAK
jgi:hypothetical protein